MWSTSYVKDVQKQSKVTSRGDFLVFAEQIRSGTPAPLNVVRYDNERGKGDHRHIGMREEPYPAPHRSS
jgi:hypothetical protein